MKFWYLLICGIGHKWRKQYTTEEADKARENMDKISCPANDTKIVEIDGPFTEPPDGMDWP